MKAFEIFLSLIHFEEGYEAKPYYCSEGYPTVAIGWRIGPKGASLDNYDMYVTKPVAKVLLTDRVNHIIDRLSKFDWFSSQNESRKAILISMAYQLGIRKLFKFEKMIEALGKHDFEGAEREAIDSIWYKQTTNRAVRHSGVLRSGDLELCYGDELEKYRL